MAAHDNRNATHNDLQTLKARYDLREIAAAHWGRGKRAGKAVLYRSPWREDHKPSLAIYADGFKDFATGETGDLFAFFQRESGLTFQQTRERLTQQSSTFHIHERNFSTSSDLSTPHEPPAAAWQEAARQAIEQAAHSLQNQPEMLKCLYEWGYSADDIQALRLGYNPTWRKIGYRDAAGAVKLAPGIVYPAFVEGVLWAVKVRQLRGSPKYIHLRGSKPVLYNADAIRPGQPLILTEGEKDAINAQHNQAGIPAVTLGSASNRFSRRWLEQVQQASPVYIIMDNDAAGQEAAQALAEQVGDKARVVTLPEQVNDVTEFMQAGGDLGALLNQHMAWWPQGVPDSYRRALIKYFRPTAAPLVELVNSAVLRGLLKPAGFTVNDLLIANTNLGFSISEGSLRRALNDLVGGFFSVLHPIETDSVCNFAKKGHRPAHLYALLPLAALERYVLACAWPRIYERQHPTSEEEAVLAKPQPGMLEALGFEAPPALAAALSNAYGEQLTADSAAHYQAAIREYRDLKNDLCWQFSAPLPQGWPLSSGANYKASFRRALEEIDPDSQRSVGQIAALVGVSRRSVQALHRRAGLKAEAQFEERRLLSAANTPQQVRKGAYEVRGRAMRLIVHTADGRRLERGYDMASAQGFVEEQLAAGGQVFVRYQTANKYKIVRAGPPPVPKRSLVAGQRAASAAAPRPACPAKARYYGPGYDPEWVSAQLRLGLEAVRSERYGWHGTALVDKTTGELWHNPHPELLVGLILRDPLIEELLELGGVIGSIS